MPIDRFKNHFFFILNIFIFSNFFFSQNYEFDFNQIFNKKLSDAEKITLSQGNTLIRNTKKSSNMILLPCNSLTQQVILDITKLKPSYLAEIIRIIPVNKKPNLLKDLKQILTDIPSYKGIPYYSEYNKIWVDLYSKAQIKSTMNIGKSQKISADFYMNPFDDFCATIILNDGGNNLFYENYNSTPIIYKGISCISSGNMKSYIIAFESQDYWILYGIGGVNAPRIPLLTNRIELSFINRIKTFCNFVFSKLAV